MQSITLRQFLAAFTFLAAPVFLIAGALFQPAFAKDEMLVTVRKQSESIRDVPISVAAFATEDIKELGLKSIEDIALLTPGFSFTSAFGRQPGSDRPAMRGISTVQNGVANASAVAYFVDGIYLGGSPQSTELSNLERVEVMRGPQAAQFGRGTYMGAINYITRKPSDVLEGELEASAGADGYAAGTGWISGPITDGLSFYVGAGFDTFDGQYTNQANGEDVGGEEAMNLTGKLFWAPTDNVDVSFKLGYQETDDDHFVIYLQPRGLNNCCFRDAMAPRAREYYQGKAVPDENNVNLATDLLDLAGGSGAELERTLAALSINWEINDRMTLTSLTGYVDDEVQTGLDSSYAGYDPFSFPPSFNGAFYMYDEDEQSDFSQELRLDFDITEGVHLTFGGYYYEGETEEGVSLSINPNTLAVGPNPFVSGRTMEDIENIAVFGGVDWQINDRWNVGLELRYAEDEISVKEVANDPVTAPIEGCDSRANLCKETFESFTPRLTALFRLNDAVNLYANVAQGTKPGDFNSDVPDLPSGDPDESLRAVDEEEAWNYELGAKTLFWDGRATVNVAGYYVAVQDQQLTQVIELPGGFTTSILQNVGETEVWGIEFESSVNFTDELSASLTYAWTDSEITERISTDEADLNGSDGSFAQNQALGNVAGKTSPRIPENQLSMVVRYQRPMGADGSWYVTGNYAYEESKYAQEHNLIETGDRSIVGLRAGIIMGQWELSVWGKNIFDDDTPVDVLRYIDRRSGTLSYTPGASSSPRGFAMTLPRQNQWGATVNYRFGG
ncbi:MAG: TonB-dependent receptor [Gammaproteobacteria bacterium]|nr:TonB-dependent receptor [Gammaproteobacteria bacterium]